MATNKTYTLQQAPGQYHSDWLTFDLGLSSITRKKFGKVRLSSKWACLSNTAPGNVYMYAVFLAILSVITLCRTDETHIAESYLFRAGINYGPSGFGHFRPILITLSVNSRVYRRTESARRTYTECRGSAIIDLERPPGRTGAELVLIGDNVTFSICCAIIDHLCSAPSQVPSFF